MTAPERMTIRCTRAEQVADSGGDVPPRHPMKLGVRYIAVDRDGNLQQAVSSTRSENDIEWSETCRNDETGSFTRIPGSGHHLVVDLDSLPPASATEAEQHESQWLYHYARLLEVRPDARPEDAVAAELVRLRAECERMRPVLDAACDWMERGYQNKQDTPLMIAVQQYRSSAQPQVKTRCRCGATARGTSQPHEDWCDSATTLTADERDALSKITERVRHGLRAGWNSVESDRFVSAIDKLRGQR